MTSTVNTSGDLPLELSKQLYKEIYLIRRCEELIVRLYPDNEMKTPMHMSMGQEATPLAVCNALSRNCDITATYRSHAAFIAQTLDHQRFFGELHGRVNGTADGKSGSMHLSAPELGMLGSTGIVSAGISIAVGAAYANKVHGNGRIAVSFFGDGATDEGVFWESLNVACLMKLPMIFVCEDNDIAVHTRKADRRGYKSLPDVARQFECIVREDESNDVESIYALTQEAVSVMRQVEKPVLLNVRCYRYLEPVGTVEDSDAIYRIAEEDALWKSLDCVAMQRNRLLEKCVADREISAMERSVDDALEISVKTALSAQPPGENLLFKGVFFNAD